MLPKYLYESLPYTQLTGGASVIVLSDNPWMVFCGLLLFSAGALVWMMRSDNRRRDGHLQLDFDWLLSRPMYELKPFFYQAFGLVAASQADNSLVVLAATTVACYGLFVMILRAVHRQCVSPRQDY